MNDATRPAPRQPSSRGCFVCGRENPMGLAARWTNHPECGEVRATVEIPEHFNGYPGTVHGGILSALLDEAAVRTALLDGGFVSSASAWAVTVPSASRISATACARVFPRFVTRATTVTGVRVGVGRRKDTSSLAVTIRSSKPPSRSAVRTAASSSSADRIPPCTVPG